MQVRAIGVKTPAENNPSGKEVEFGFINHFECLLLMQFTKLQK
jgi:hypothetical protein